MGVRTIDERMVNTKFLVLFGPIGPQANLMKVETHHIHTYDNYRGVAIIVYDCSGKERNVDGWIVSHEFRVRNIPDACSDLHHRVSPHK